jgi:hypothetical protein
MTGDHRSGSDDFKAKQKERARLARKAAYAKQKERLKERKEALRADPEYQRKQAERRQALRERYREEKQKMKSADAASRRQSRQAARELSESERRERDRQILAELIPASHLNSDHEDRPETPTQEKPAQETTSPRPHLRLIKTEP